MSKGASKSTIIDEFEEEEAEASDIICDIESDVYKKVMHWIQRAKGEVSGLGKVQVIDGQFFVTSAILLKQSNTGSTTEITPEAVGKAMFELKDDPGHLNWWWHSHVDFNVFWSGTDMKTIHELGKHGWFLSTVLNKMEDKRTSYYQKGNDFIPQVFIDKVPTTVSSYVDEDVSKEWDKDFDSKVIEKTFPTATYAPYTYNYFSSVEDVTNPNYDWGDNYLDKYHTQGKSDVEIVDDPYHREDLEDKLVNDGDFTEEEIQLMALAEIERQAMEGKKAKKAKKAKKTKKGRKS